MSKKQKILTSINIAAFTGCIVVCLFEGDITEAAAWGAALVWFIEAKVINKES